MSALDEARGDLHAQDGTPRRPLTFDAARYVHSDDDGTATLSLLIENLHCAGCVNRIERTLTGTDGVAAARVSLTTRRLQLRFNPDVTTAEDLVSAVEDIGYHAIPYDPAAMTSADQAEDRLLLRCLAVAGFAAANVMLLSVSIWAGAAGADMGPATRDFMHWLSALIAMPAVAYAGRPFFNSAWAALRSRALNMDVPISLAVLLATGMSLYETMTGGAHAFYDAAVMLLFFLLIGRYLDRRARSRARSAAEQMTLLDAVSAKVKQPDGSLRAVPIDFVEPGMTVSVAPGDRVPVDGTVAAGQSSVDTSLVTGESAPRQVTTGDELFAGTVNQDGSLDITVTATGGDTLLAGIVRLMEAAEQSKARYTRLADRAARIYAPAVHLFALVAFLGWMTIGDLAWQPALLIAVSVLIITCPCALGLAVPAVQVVAAGRLMRQGIIVKSGDALERLAAIDTVVFDKTGTLTIGRPALVNGDEIAQTDLRAAASLAAGSNHPLAQALVSAAGAVPVAQQIQERPGMGIEGVIAGETARLGNRDWCGMGSAASGSASASELWFKQGTSLPVSFRFRDTVRPDAAAVIAHLRAKGLSVALISGDRPAATEALAQQVGLDDWHASRRPDDKVAYLEQLARQGRTTLMVGDGLNDAPALAAAQVSISPAAAADISRTAADIIVQGEALTPILEALTTARRARRLILQNFALAGLYNMLALPLAVAGLVTPLVAAAAMSASSLVVTANAMRLARLRSTTP